MCVDSTDTQTVRTQVSKQGRLFEATGPLPFSRILHLCPHTQTYPPAAGLMTGLLFLMDTGAGGGEVRGYRVRNIRRNGLFIIGVWTAVHSGPDSSLQIYSGIEQQFQNFFLLFHVRSYSSSPPPPQLFYREVVTMP
jgi:hypothetical protein